MQNSFKDGKAKNAKIYLKISSAEFTLKSLLNNIIFHFTDLCDIISSVSQET